MGDADLVDSEGEEGRNIGAVSERDRVDVFCDKCGNIRHDAGMTESFRRHHNAMLSGVGP